MRILFLLIFIIFLSTVFYFLYNRSSEEKVTQNTVEEKIDSQATFLIFTNGSLRDFSASKYHNLSKDVYIASENPNIVYVKKKGITWNDFFKTLPMKVTSDCLTTGTGQKFCTNENGSLKFFLNGKRDDDLLSKEIKNGDKALITYGNESESKIQQQLKFLE